MPSTSELILARNRGMCKKTEKGKTPAESNRQKIWKILLREVRDFVNLVR